MKTAGIGFLMIVTFILAAALVYAVHPEGPLGTGEALFKHHCSACHPNGGNIYIKNKTLSKKDREANNIFTAQDIVKKMRNPGPAPKHPSEFAGMKFFDEKAISDTDAQKVADYILQTFK